VAVEQCVAVAQIEIDAVQVRKEPGDEPRECAGWIDRDGAQFGWIPMQQRVDGRDILGGAGRSRLRNQPQAHDASGRDGVLLRTQVQINRIRTECGNTCYRGKSCDTHMQPTSKPPPKTRPDIAACEPVTSTRFPHHPAVPLARMTASV